MRLADRVAIVTGGANGIGRATVRRLAEEGASVVAVDIDRPRLEGLAAELNALGRRVVPVYCDLTDAASVKEMVDLAMATFGRIDILANVAGGSGMTPFYKTEEGRKQKWTEEIRESEWDATVAFNMTAPFLCIKYTLPIMKKQGSGRIINFSSAGADIGHQDSSFAYAAYAAAKAGITGLTRQLAVEVGPFGITANCVCPGAVLSERMQARFDTDWKDRKDEFAKQACPLRRMGSVDELAAAVAFLASDDASYVNGITLDVNGGRYMR